LTFFDQFDRGFFEAQKYKEKPILQETAIE